MLNLLPDASYTLGVSTATVTIVDDDGDPSLVAHWKLDETSGQTAAGLCRTCGW